MMKKTLNIQQVSPDECGLCEDGDYLMDQIELSTNQQVKANLCLDCIGQWEIAWKARHPLH